MGKISCRAAICREFKKNLSIETISIDAPKQSELQIKINACAICHSDIAYMNGEWGGNLPAIYGHEAVGIVVETGNAITNIKKGDYVLVTLLRSCGKCHFCQNNKRQLCQTQFPLDTQTRIRDQNNNGITQGLRTAAFAEYVIVEESQIIPIPKQIKPQNAALLACGVITGVGAVINTANIEKNTDIVVIGAGGVGLNIIQGAKIAQAQNIIAIDIHEDKLKAAKHFGAHHLINANKENDMVQTIRTYTQNLGADYVFVSVGNKNAANAATNYIKAGGSVIIVGMPPSNVITQFETANFAAAEHKIIGSKMGSTQLQNDIPKLITLYQNKILKLDELVTHTYPLEQINTAIKEVVQGHVLRNVIVF